MNKFKNSLMTSCGAFVLVSMIVMVWPLCTRADTVRQMNLEEMCERADKVFRGTVVSATPGTIRVGGIDLPTTTYRVRVVEIFKGEFKAAKGAGYVEIRMLGALKPEKRGTGTGRVAMVLADLPRLEVGESYLLLTTRPSRIGMSTTVGLGQGLFRIKGAGSKAEAVNENDNQMLFRGMDAQGHTGRGPMAYRKLAERVRALVGAKRKAL